MQRVQWTMVVPFGLATLVLVAACRPTDGGAPAPMTRSYYIAAEEVDWDYAPTGTNLTMGRAPEGLEVLLLTSGRDRVGRVYKKALYREYTDSTFTTRKERGPAWEHLGYLGPVIRGVVGDTLRIVFKNTASHPYSVHPHGVFYAKDSEGAAYADSTSGADRHDDGVPTGGTHTYTWTVPERAGPSPSEGSSVMWMYHSHVDEAKDVNAGLMGPMLITRRDMAKPDGSPRDVDRELVVAFAEFDENVSWYFEPSIRAFAGNPASVVRTINFAEPAYALNLRESINGFSFGHLKGLTMRVGERVRWYVFATGNFELHAPHWHGQTALAHHMRTDVLSLLTMQMVTADMVPDNPGTWLFHCHVGPHMDFGMSSLFVVQ